MSFGDYMLFIIGAILVNNILLARFLGNCPFLGVSRRMDTATGMSMAVIFVMTMAGMITWLVQYYILLPLDIEYLQTIAFILVIAALVQLVEIVMAKSLPALYRALGIFLPLITTNCAVLGVALLNIQEEHGFVESLLYGFGSALGFTVVMVIFAGLRERLTLAQVPVAFAGAPIGFVVAGLLSLAFMGFAGLTVN